MRLVTRLRERMGLPTGQTMTEYALILATIAVVAVSLYTQSGFYLKGLVEHIDSFLL